MSFSEASIRQVEQISFDLLDIDNIDEFRREATEQLTHFFHACSTAFFHWADADHTPQRLRREDIYFNHLDTQYQNLYFDEVLLSDPLIEWRTKGQLPPKVTTLSEITLNQGLEENVLYRQILHPNKYQDVLTISLLNKHSLLGSISLARESTSPNYDGADLQLAKLFIPTISAAYSNLLLRQKLADDIRQERVSCHKAIQHRFGLTKREHQLVMYIEQGLNSSEIADQLSISRWTVKNHLKAIYRKVGVNNRVKLLQKTQELQNKTGF